MSKRSTNIYILRLKGLTCNRVNIGKYREVGWKNHGESKIQGLDSAGLRLRNIL